MFHHKAHTQESRLSHAKKWTLHLTTPPLLKGKLDWFEASRIRCGESTSKSRWHSALSL